MAFPEKEANSFWEMVKKVFLENFRNFSHAEFQFEDGINVIVGPNGSGKTNLLESLFFVSTGKSFKAKLEEDMINYSKEKARVKALLVSEGNGKEVNNLEIILTRGFITVGEIRERKEKVPRKRLLINGVGKRLVDYKGLSKVVLFGPWDLGIITESPAWRRDFLDNILSQVDRDYRRAILSYNKGLKQRNRLLLKIRDEGASYSLLSFWNKLLIKNGDFISQKREEFISFINKTKGFDDRIFFAEYDKSAISESRLEQYKKEEVLAATTLVGPHRDDVIFYLVKEGLKKNLSSFGSRAEQRLCVLWLKKAELKFVEEKTKELPLLLLDDLFSELDHSNREIVLDLAKLTQTVITTADPHFIKEAKKYNLIELGLQN